MTADLTTYQNAVADLVAAQEDNAAELQRHFAARDLISERIRAAEALIYHAEHGGNADAFDTARGVLAIRWGWNRNGTPGYRFTPQVKEQILRAVDVLRNDKPLLRHQYLGVKEYASWPSQAVECPYGTVPTHGSVWFRIGYRVPSYAPTAEERLRCVQYLLSVLDNPDLRGDL